MVIVVASTKAQGRKTNSGLALVFYQVHQLLEALARILRLEVVGVELPFGGRWSGSEPLLIQNTLGRKEEAMRALLQALEIAPRLSSETTASCRAVLFYLLPKPQFCLTCAP